MKTLAVIQNEGFTCPIHIEDDGSVTFIADCDIDADGANGQSGEKAAYRSDGRGSEALANGGMGIRAGRVVFINSWGPDIAEVDDDGNPLVIDGIIISKTAYVHRGESDRRRRYVDSQVVPYIVVPPVIVRGVPGIVLGCKARIEHRGSVCECVVADIGPRRKIGEASIAAARAVGIPDSPRTGGLSLPKVRYTLWPGVPAMVNGFEYPLQRSN